MQSIDNGPRFKVGLSQIVKAAGISDSPSQYSGRGATLTDLDSDRLSIMHGVIERGIGAEAARRFVLMVAAIPELSATEFLLTLGRLERNQWRWDVKLLGGQKGVSGEGRGTYLDSEATAFAEFASALTGLGRTDDTERIRGEFLSKYPPN